MKKTFLEYKEPLLTVMVQADNPDRIKDLMKKSTPLGGEAYGIQFEKMKKEFKSENIYKDLFSYTDKPTYVTNYRSYENEGKTDETLANELIEFSKCGATLCDMMGDFFDKQKGEFTTNEDAIKKQMELVNKLHESGSEVLMSSHVLEFTPAEKVLEIALGHQSRGADISKIVVGANSMQEQIENIRIMNLLKENLKIPFLFLSGGECHILRRIGCEFGSCMYLCVYEHDRFSTPQQPLLINAKAIRENMK